MKFTTSSFLLLNALQNSVKLITSRQTMPILEYFLFSINDGKLTITTSDLETTLISTIDLDNSDKDGVVAIPSKLIIDSLREFTDQPITIYVDEDTYEVSVMWQTGQISMPGLNGIGYPEIAEFEQDATNEVNIKASWIFGIINKLSFATADNNLRPIMNGIYFDIYPDKVIYVATDAHKMVRAIMMGETGVEAPASFILPKKTGLLLKPIVQKESEDVNIKFDAKNIVITVGNNKLICRQIEGRYPNYQAVIPVNNVNKILIDRSLLLNCVKRVSVCSNQSNNLVKLNISQDKIELIAKDVDFSKAANDTVACSYSGTALEIGFKSISLIEMLSNISSSEVSVELLDSTRAALIVPYESNDPIEKDMVMLLVPIMI